MRVNRSALTGLAGLVLALLGLPVLGVVAAPAAHAGTISGTGIGISWPANDSATPPDGSTIDVPAPPPGARITDVNVHVNGLSGTDPAYLEIILVDPRGSAVRLVASPGLTYDPDVGYSNIDLTLDDEAPRQITCAYPDPARDGSGTYQPSSCNSNGAWDTPDAYLQSWAAPNPLTYRA